MRAPERERPISARDCLQTLADSVSCSIAAPVAEKWEMATETVAAAEPAVVAVEAQAVVAAVIAGLVPTAIHTAIAT